MPKGNAKVQLAQYNDLKKKKKKKGSEGNQKRKTLLFYTYDKLNLLSCQFKLYNQNQHFHWIPFPKLKENSKICKL